MTFNKIPSDIQETLALALGFLALVVLSFIFASIWSLQPNLLAMLESVGLLVLFIISLRKAT